MSKECLISFSPQEAVDAGLIIALQLPKPLSKPPLACGAIASIVLIAGGVFLILAAHEILPNHSNPLSQDNAQLLFTILGSCAITGGTVGLGAACFFPIRAKIRMSNARDNMVAVIEKGFDNHGNLGYQIWEKDGRITLSTGDTGAAISSLSDLVKMQHKAIAEALEPREVYFYRKGNELHLIDPSPSQNNQAWDYEIISPYELVFRDSTDAQGRVRTAYEKMHRYLGYYSKQYVLKANLLHKLKFQRPTSAT